MTVTKDDFNKIWASTSPLTPYEFSENQYKEGWNFVGSTPPSRQMWDFLQKNNDEKMKYLADNYLPLSGGSLTGNLGFNGSGCAFITRNINNNRLEIMGGTAWNTSASLVLSGKDRDGGANGGIFELYASIDNNPKKLVGKPDGTLTWDGQPLLPVGVVQAFAGNTIPNGWLLCDGSAVSRTTYANLFACIGTTYGAGNGSTTFNLPNLTNRFIQGNSTVGTVNNAGLPNITGDFMAYSFSTGGGNGAFNSSVSSPNVLKGSSDQNLNWNSYTFDASRSNSIYGNSTTVQPPALTMQHIIKY